MTVSGQHERLVSHIIRWIKDRYSSSGDLCIYADHIDWPSNAKPIQLGGFIPDVYAVGISIPLTVIGEAETVRSIDGPHAAKQIGAFIDFLIYQKNPILIIAVPWTAVPRARSLIRNTLRRMGNPLIETVCLERLE